MIKKMKRFAALIVAAVSISAVGISAYAATDATAYYYSFNFSGYGGSSWTSGVQKEDKADYASVIVNNGHVSDEAYAYVAVYSSPSTGNAITGSAKVTSNNEINYLKYLITQDDINKIPAFYLGASGSYYGSNFSGYWWP